MELISDLILDQLNGCSPFLLADVQRYYQKMGRFLNSIYDGHPWRRARADEGNGLENRRASNGSVGSNPTVSANTASPVASRIEGMPFIGCQNVVHHEHQTHDRRNERLAQKKSRGIGPGHD